MIRIICPNCKNGYLETKDNLLCCPECQGEFSQNEENLYLGIQYYNEYDYDKANDCLMKYIVKNGAEPRAIFHKALCDGFCFDEDTLSLAETYDKLFNALEGMSEDLFPHYLALANDEAQKLEKAVAQSHIHLFADADAEKIKKEVSVLIGLQNDAKAFRVKLNALTNNFNDNANIKLSVKFSDCFLVEPELATQVGDLKFQKITENVASHTVFTGILSTDIKNLEIYYRCIVMFFKKNRQKYEFLMASAEKFAELSQLLSDGQYNTIKGTASIGDKLKSAGYDFFQESLKDTDEDYSTQTETVVILDLEIEKEENVPEEIEDISSTATEKSGACEAETEENFEDVSSSTEAAVAEETQTDDAELEETEADFENEETEEIHVDCDASDEQKSEAETIDEVIDDEQQAPVEEAVEDTQDETCETSVQTDEVIVEEHKEEAVNTSNSNESQETEETVSTETSKEENKPTKVKHKTHYGPIIVVLLIIAGIAAIICTTVVPAKINEKNYAQAQALTNEGKYKEAAAVYAELKDYENSQELYKAATYNYASQLEKQENFDEAKKIYEGLGKYEDSMAKASSCTYNLALKTLDEGKFDEAKAIFESIPDYADSKDKVSECTYQKGISFIDEKKYEEAIEIFKTLPDYKPAQEKILEAKYKYVNNNLSKDNKTTITFLNELIEARYQDSVAIRRKLLGDVTVTGEGVTSCINYSASDIKENLNEVEKSKPIYFHVTVTDEALYGKKLTVKFTTSVGYTERKTVTLSKEDNTYHLMYPRTSVSNYTVDFSLLSPEGTELLKQTVTIK